MLRTCRRMNWSGQTGREILITIPAKARGEEKKYRPHKADDDDEEAAYDDDEDGYGLMGIVKPESGSKLFT